MTLTFKHDSGPLHTVRALTLDIRRAAKPATFRPLDRLGKARSRPMPTDLKRKLKSRPSPESIRYFPVERKDRKITLTRTPRRASRTGSAEDIGDHIAHRSPRCRGTHSRHTHLHGDSTCKIPMCAGLPIRNRYWWAASLSFNRRLPKISYRGHQTLSSKGQGAFAYEIYSTNPENYASLVCQVFGLADGASHLPVVIYQPDRPIAH
jgi:hypothetical protein